MLLHKKKKIKINGVRKNCYAKNLILLKYSTFFFTCTPIFIEIWPSQLLVLSRNSRYIQSYILSTKRVKFILNVSSRVHKTFVSVWSKC